MNLNVFQAVRFKERIKEQYTMLDQKDTTVFPMTSEEKLIEFQGAIYELEEALRKLDELRRREVAEKEAALAETLNMKKLTAVKIGDSYDVLSEGVTTCIHCDYPSRSGICFRCS